MLALNHRLLSNRLVNTFLSIFALGALPAEAFGGDETEYDYAILDPGTAFGSPYGGFSRATASRLASLPLKLPNVPEELSDFEPVFMNVRDANGRPFSCRAYHQDELDPESLGDSMFDLAREFDPTTIPEALDDPFTQTSEVDEANRVWTPEDIEERLSQLSGICVQNHQGWWSYEWCYKDRVTQFHVELSMDKAGTKQKMFVEDLTVTSLGEFARREILLHPNKRKGIVGEQVTNAKGDKSNHLSDNSMAEVVDSFMEGETCEESGKPRETKAVLRCCTPGSTLKNKGGILLRGRPHDTDLIQMHGVKESDDAVCTYTVDLCTPLLCEDQSSRRIQVGEVPTALSGKSSGAMNFMPEVDQIEKMSVTDIVEATFGGVRKACVKSETGGWWAYELCPGHHIRQYHEVTLLDRVTGSSRTSVETEHILGLHDPSSRKRVPKEEDWQYVVNITDVDTTMSGKSKGRSRTPMAHAGNGAHFFQEYSGGDVCDHADVTDSAIKAGEVGEGLIERSTTIRYGCGNRIEMTVKEDSTCHYIAHVSIPALCHHPLFKAPVSKKQVVKCVSIS